MKEIEIFISETGEIEFIYDDELADLCIDSDFVTKRASHVEPSGSGWSADMTPILDTVDLQTQQKAIELFGGPVLGTFATRGEALMAEQVWIKSFLGNFQNARFTQNDSLQEPQVV